MHPIEIRFNTATVPEVLAAILFEYKDQYTLQTIENILHSIIPGDYKVVDWTSMDADFDVIIQFSCIEEFVLFQMIVI